MKLRLRWKVLLCVFQVTMKMNPDKIHFLRDKKNRQVDMCNKKLSNTCSENLFGVKIDNLLTFEE